MNTNTNAQAVADFIAYCANQPDAPVRRWSYEIEAVNLGAVSYQLQDLGLVTHQDGSVTESDCHCDCDSCAHSCNCDNCDITNGYADNDHCSDCLDTECAPADHKPVVTSHDLGRLPEACSWLQREAYVDDSCGGHIHVDASGLTKAQAIRIGRVWHNIQTHLADLIGRDYGQFAGQFTDAQTAYAEADSPERYLAVNLSNIANEWRGYTAYKRTVEFRQFAGTLEAEVITARGFLCRAIVEYCASNQPIYWLMRAQNGYEVLKALGFPITPAKPAEAPTERTEANEALDCTRPENTDAPEGSTVANAHQCECGCGRLVNESPAHQLGLTRACETPEAPRTCACGCGQTRYLG